MLQLVCMAWSTTCTNMHASKHIHAVYWIPFLQATQRLLMCSYNYHTVKFDSKFYPRNPVELYIKINSHGMN